MGNNNNNNNIYFENLTHTLLQYISNQNEIYVKEKNKYKFYVGELRYSWIVYGSRSSKNLCNSFLNLFC